jgi:hypothetical protein
MLEYIFNDIRWEVSVFCYILHLLSYKHKKVHNNFYTLNIQYCMYNYIYLCVDGPSISDYALGPWKVRNGPAYKVCWNVKEEGSWIPAQTRRAEQRIKLLRNPNKGLCGQIPNMPLRAITVSIYRTYTPSYETEIRKRPEAQPYIQCLVCFFCRAYGKGDGSSTASCASTADGGRERIWWSVVT